MSTIRKVFRVTIEKEIHIEIMPSLFGGLTEAEYLDNFRKGLWYVESMDDIYEYAARMAAYDGGGMQCDGLGLLNTDYSTYPRTPDVKFREVSDECSVEFLGDLDA